MLRYLWPFIVCIFAVSSGFNQSQHRDKHEKYGGQSHPSNQGDFGPLYKRTILYTLKFHLSQCWLYIVKNGKFSNQIMAIFAQKISTPKIKFEFISRLKRLEHIYFRYNLFLGTSNFKLKALQIMINIFLIFFAKWVIFLRLVQSPWWSRITPVYGT